MVNVKYCVAVNGVITGGCTVKMLWCATHKHHTNMINKHTLHAI